ncbi:hypothetical protein [Bacillus cereus]|uniref:hypothetical protein n=1 Tax=Bacillus cereus TaxID=1396 RepID=UPI000BF9B9C3|nr:hypothetical protein [Bacillus cereus]PFR36753.1 hypothetical protein COK20_17460 [Bacillus cereus]PFW23803.1 hypothetical protein COL07_25300 [Bacillus cereus]
MKESKQIYKLHYDEPAGIITIENEHGAREILADSFSGELKFSPDGTKVVDITPLEWEVSSHLYVFDLKTGNRNKIELCIDTDTQKAKDVIWFNESN